MIQIDRLKALVPDTPFEIIASELQTISNERLKEWALVNLFVASAYNHWMATFDLKQLPRLEADFEIGLSEIKSIALDVLGPDNIQRADRVERVLRDKYPQIINQRLEYVGNGHRRNNVEGSAYDVSKTKQTVESMRYSGVRPISTDLGFTSKNSIMAPSHLPVIFLNQMTAIISIREGRYRRLSIEEGDSVPSNAVRIDPETVVVPDLTFAEVQSVIQPPGIDYAQAMRRRFDARPS